MRGKIDTRPSYQSSFLLFSLCVRARVIYFSHSLPRLRPYVQQLFKLKMLSSWVSSSSSSAAASKTTMEISIIGRTNKKNDPTDGRTLRHWLNANSYLVVHLYSTSPAAAAAAATAEANLIAKGTSFVRAKETLVLN